MAAVKQGDPAGPNNGWQTSFTTSAAQETVTFNAYQGYNVDISVVPSHWSNINNQGPVATAVAGSANSWGLTASASDEDTPGTTLTISSG